MMMVVWRNQVVCLWNCDKPIKIDDNLIRINQFKSGQLKKNTRRSIWIDDKKGASPRIQAVYGLWYLTQNYQVRKMRDVLFTDLLPATEWEKMTLKNHKLRRNNVLNNCSRNIMFLQLIIAFRVALIHHHSARKGCSFNNFESIFFFFSRYIVLRSTLNIIHYPVIILHMVNNGSVQTRSVHQFTCAFQVVKVVPYSKKLT